MHNVQQDILYSPVKDSHSEWLPALLNSIVIYFREIKIISYVSPSDFHLQTDKWNNLFYTLQTQTEKKTKYHTQKLEGEK
jgi:hypothetical protein